MADHTDADAELARALQSLEEPVPESSTDDAQREVDDGDQNMSDQTEKGDDGQAKADDASPAEAGSSKKRKKSESKRSRKEKVKKTSDMRRNIKKIIADDKLDEQTLAARREEEERIKRVAQATQQHYNSIIQQQRSSGAHLEAKPSTSTADVICISSDDEESVPTMPAWLHQQRANTELIELGSDDDEPVASCSTAGKSNKTASDGEGDVIDLNNCGVHVNDALNVPDGEGRVLVNVGHPEEDPDIFLCDHLAANIKPHQIGGVRFLYDNVVESKQKFARSRGLGCILAHSMGLGKTFQIIAFVDVFLKHTTAKHVMCIVPINTLQNWIGKR